MIKRRAPGMRVQRERRASVGRVQKRFQCGAVTSSRLDKGKYIAGSTDAESDEGAVTVVASSLLYSTADNRVLCI
jgi:hypothetical protein